MRDEVEVTDPILLPDESFAQSKGKEKIWDFLSFLSNLCETGASLSGCETCHANAQRIRKFLTEIKEF